MWDAANLLDCVRDALIDADRDLAEQQAVRGLDALDELAVHPIIADALHAAGFGVLREQPYPGEAIARPADRDRLRCDLVLLEDPDATLQDPVLRIREQDRAEGTLFEQTERQRTPDDHAVPTTDAFWLEIKTVGQFVIIDGYAQPNRTYASELVKAIAQDVRKLSKDPGIDAAGLLLVLFTADEAIARHDLTMALHRCLDRDLAIGSPEIDSLPIADRIGNTRCLVALIPARNAD